jgi:hypothetical protein
MNVAKKAKPARPAKKAKKAKPARPAAKAKSTGFACRVGAVSVLLSAAVLLCSGCAATLNRTPIMSESGGETVVAYATALKTGFGNKEATTLGNYTLSADGGLSISNLSNQNDASIAFVRAVELGASLGAAYAGQPGAVSTAPDGGAAINGGDTILGPTVARAASASVDVGRAAAEARAAGKTLVVVAGHPLCGYCTRFEAALNASGIPGRTDIVLVRELNPWESNTAYRWTGGGNAPVVRVTSWDASGNVICDRKLNRPGTVAEIESAISACGLACN